MSDDGPFEPVGVLGAGVMGSAMAARLRDNGVSVRVWDVDNRRLEELEHSGFSVAATRDALLEFARTLVVSLPGPPQVTEAMTGTEGIIGGAREELTVLDTSTVDPLTSRKIAAATAGTPVRYLAAPVIGGEPAAQAGTLTMIVGGERSTFEASRPILDILGGEITFVTDPGAATTIKLVNNLMSLTNTVTLMEGLAVAARNGVDASTVHQALRTGSGYSAAFERRWNKHLKTRDFDAGFSIDLAIKDLSLVQALAKDVGLPLSLSSIALQVYRVAALRDLGTKDVAALALWWEDLLKTRLTD